MEQETNIKENYNSINHKKFHDYEKLYYYYICAGRRMAG